MEVVPASDSPSVRSRLVHRIGPLLGLLLFAGALWVLHHQLKAYRFHDIIQSLENLPAKRIFAALALTFLSYLVMTGYDALALLWELVSQAWHCPLPPRIPLQMSFPASPS